MESQHCRPSPNIQLKDYGSKYKIVLTTSCKTEHIWRTTTMVMLIFLMMMTALMMMMALMMTSQRIEGVGIKSPWCHLHSRPQFNWNLFNDENATRQNKKNGWIMMWQSHNAEIISRSFHRNQIHYHYHYHCRSILGQFNGNQEHGNSKH